MSDNKLNEIISTSLDNIRSIADANTIIGNPISAPGGTVIIPVSKVSLGFASGGADYFSKKEDEKKEKAADPKAASTSGNSSKNGRLPCFAGGGGTGVSITPLCFLVVHADGETELLNIVDPKAASGSPASNIVDTVSNFIESSPDLIARFKDVFAKKKDPSSALDDEITKDILTQDEENDKKKK